MDIVIIAAISRNNIIGRDGTIPWNYRADMRHFQRTTHGHPVIMGRKTFDSLPRRPLPGRPNIVLSRNPAYPVPAGVTLCRNLREAIAHCRSLDARKAFVLGGAQIYRLALPLADELLLTHIPDEVEGDTPFPAWAPETWEIVDSREEDGLHFVTYRRRSDSGPTSI